MADTHGNPSDPVIDELLKRPYAFDFFQAVRLLECRRPDLRRVGFSISPSEDAVRFWQNPSLRFAPSAIEAVRVDGAGTVPRMAVNFFGLFGPNAPMPPHVTEYALERELHHHDPTITAFFNLFHHRLLSLFYRAWAANQKVVDLDRFSHEEEDDDDGDIPTKPLGYAFYIGSLFGIGMKSLRERDAVPDMAKLFFSGRLACQTRNAEGLEAILKAYFHIPAEVQPFAGRWLHLPGDSLCQLGESPESGSLGVNAIAGSRFWDCQLSFRMKFGPMSLADYERMLPRGDAFERLKYWVLNYCGEHFFWDVQLVLKAEEVPATRLGETGPRMLSTDDIVDLASLVTRLSSASASDQVSQYLWSELSPEARQILLNENAAASLLQRKQTLVTELNRIIGSGPLYDAQRFAGVSIRTETKSLLAGPAQNLDPARLNRRLLEDAYPQEISRERRAGGLGWATWLKTKPFTHDAGDLTLNPPPA